MIPTGSFAWRHNIAAEPDAFTARPPRPAPRLEPLPQAGPAHQVGGSRRGTQAQRPPSRRPFRPGAGRAPDVLCYVHRMAADLTGIAVPPHNQRGRAPILAPIGAAAEPPAKRKPDRPMGATR